jgi:O-antigen/teichoic acid export membrane protein
MFLYPLMISRNGLDVVGVWSLLVAIGTFIGVVDIGFSQLLTREIGSDMNRASVRDARADYTASVRAYGVLLVFLTALFLVFKDLFLPVLGNVYPANALTVSIILILVGAIVQLVGRLDSAILSAYQDNHAVQLITAVAPIFTYASALTGALLFRPIEGLAIGTVLSALVTVMALRFRLSSRHSQWLFAKTPQTVSETRTRLTGLVHRGWYLYSSSVGLFVRGPAFRFVVAAALGLQATAVLDIAMRLTQTVRDIIASGFNVLYPSFSYLHRNGDRQGIVELMQVALMVLLPLGAAALGLLAGAADHVLSLWLGHYPKDLAGAIRVLSLWQILTLVNVPFWFLLQAAHHEKVAAASVWVHTIFVFIAYPVQRVFSLNIMDLLVYWTVTSVFTQCLIYFYIERKLGLLWEVVLNARVVALLAMAAVFFLWSFSLPLGQTLGHSVLFSGIGLLLFSVASAMTVGKPVYRFIRAARA